MDHLTVTQAAEALGVSVPTIKRYIYEGKLRSVKLPGGQHRVPRSEIDRVLAGGSGPAATAAASDPDQGSTSDRVAVLERWVTELQAEVERLTAALEVVSRYCARATRSAEKVASPPVAASAPRILVLGPGCKRCDALYHSTLAVLQSMGRSDVVVERVRNMDDIASFGPVITPALVVAGHVVCAGRVPTSVALRGLLEPHLR